LKFEEAEDKKITAQSLLSFKRLAVTCKFRLNLFLLAEDNRLSRSNVKIEPVFQQVGGFLQVSLHQSRVLRHTFNFER